MAICPDSAVTLLLLTLIITPMCCSLHIVLKPHRLAAGPPCYGNRLCWCLCLWDYVLCSLRCFVTCGIFWLTIVFVVRDGHLRFLVLHSLCGCDYWHFKLFEVGAVLDYASASGMRSAIIVGHFTSSTTYGCGSYGVLIFDFLGCFISM